MNMICPKVSIILVNYNGAKDTIECLDSLSRITYENVETIVVDNASTDDSVSLLDKVKEKYNFILLISKINGGFSYGNNLGIEYAIQTNSDYVLLLNNDTVVEPDFLTQLMVHATNSVVLTGTIYYEKERKKIWYAGGSISNTTVRTKHYFENEIDCSLPKNNIEISFVTGCEMLIPIDVIKKIGMLDEDYFLYSEDADYSLRLGKAGIKMVYVPKSIIYHKVSVSTSKIPKISQYYSVRNRRMLISKNLKGVKK